MCLKLQTFNYLCAMKFAKTKILMLCLALFLVHTSRAQEGLLAAIDSLLADSVWQTAQVGICLYDVTADSTIYAYNANQRMRPASTEKVITAIAALDNLGPAHPFNTQLFVTGETINGVLQGDLWVRGGMDPLFMTTDLQCICDSLHAQGIDSITGRVCLDLSMKDSLQWGWGWCWDDDNYTLTPLLMERKPLEEMQLIEALRAVGIHIAPAMRQQPAVVCPSNASPILLHSTPLTAVLMPMMKESDNLHAECVFYLLAARSGRPWSGRKQAVNLIQNTLRRAGVDPAMVQVADGSGLSLYNYQTPYVLTRMLIYAAHNPTIYQALTHALPIAGVDGTLKTRMRGTAAAGNVRAKTGTVTGVTSLAGYATRPDDHLIAFAIIVNGLQKGAVGRTLQDDICTVICSKDFTPACNLSAPSGLTNTHYTNNPKL